MKNKVTEICLQSSWVYTEDLDSTTKFYADALGLECIRETVDARIFATTATAAIGICRIFGDRVIEPKGGMISIVSGDVDACYRRLRGNGLDIQQAPRRFERFGIYSFFVSDPNGYVIEFQQFDA